MADAGSTKLPAPFGKYLLTQLIAVGGMAEVYRAKIFGASGFEKEMVVKRILPKYAQNPNFVQMLIDEAKIAVSLSHGNIVPIYELGELEGSYYIAMEYVEGRTVLDILRDAHSKRHPLPWPYCLAIAADVAKGLSYAHSRPDQTGKPLGLVHRDINPRNIVITPAGEVKILDFGIARASTKRHQTASGVIKGTPGYMSPEQMYGQNVDARSDIYCLGILIYELLTLRRLFPVWDVNEMRAVFEAGPIPLPSTIAKHVGREVDPVIMKALTQDVSERYQNGNEFEEDLRKLIARSGTAVTSGGLAREIIALDEAAGPRAPRTAPPVVSSQVSSQAGGAPSSQLSPADAASSPRSQGGAAPMSPSQPGPSTGSGLGSGAPRPSTGGGITRSTDGPSRPGVARTDHPTAPEPRALPTQAQPPNTKTTQASGVRTQPMPLQRDMAPGKLDTEHSFVISLAEGPMPAPLAPLPSTSAQAVSHDKSRTHVLAQNDHLAWTNEIGQDAEWLALMRATGASPDAGRRTMLVASAFALLGIVAVGAFAGGDLMLAAKRALSGKKQELGVIIAKTIPSGAKVVIDGKDRGKTNLKLTGVDIDEPHRLVITPEGKEPIILEIQRADFQQGEDGFPTYLFERDFTPPKETPDAGPTPGEEPKPKGKGK